MRRIYSTLVALALLLATLGIAGCTDDALITCDKFDDFMSRCSYTCSAAYDCAETYDLDLTLDEQSAVDYCADCLYDVICSDEDLCTHGGSYCLDLLETYLDIDCW